MKQAAGDPGFGIYVHWPFCAAKCPYCDFNSHVRAEIPEAAFVEAAVRELEWVAERQGRGRPLVSTIFFGGGTPSLMQGASVGRILDAVARLWTMTDDLEVTLEANPASVDASRFRDYRAAGVGRLSLGMQALDDAALKALGRLHDVQEARAALALAQKTFPRVSLDLIYAREGQTVRAWRDELHEALSFGTEHLSLYQLTIEPATPFAQLHRAGRLHIPDDDLAASLYETTQELTEAAGRPAYEISNHAAPGAESRHNLLYWRYGTYAGVGPGAHGRVELDGGRIATANERLPERWLRDVEENGHGIVDLEPIAAADAAREHLLMNLRLAEGIDLESYGARWNRRPAEAHIAALVDDDLLKCEDGILKATARGRLVLNSVIAALID